LITEYITQCCKIFHTDVVGHCFIYLIVSVFITVPDILIMLILIFVPLTTS